jgi:MFS family permease
MNIYSLAVSATMIVFGRLGDMMGRRLVFYIGIFLLLIGSVGAGLSHSFSHLIFFRGLQAVGVSATLTLAASLIIVIFGDKAPKALGVYAMVTAVGLAIGPSLGGFLVSTVGWRWVFMINVPLLTIAFAICFPVLGESKADDHHNGLDYMGVVLLVMTIGSFVYGLISGEQGSWSSYGPWCYLAASLVMGVILVWHESTVEKPIFDLRLFKNGYFAMAAMCTALVGSAVTMILFFQPLFLHQVFNYNARQIGFVLIATPAAILLFSTVMSKISARLPLKSILFISYLLILFAMIIQYGVGVEKSSLFWIIAALFLVGLSWTVCNTLAALAAQRAVGPSQASLAVGFVFTLFNVSAAVVLAVASVLFNSVSEANKALGHALAFVAGQKAVYGMLTAFTVVIIIMGIALLVRTKKSTCESIQH